MNQTQINPYAHFPFVTKIALVLGQTPIIISDYDGVAALSEDEAFKQLTGLMNEVLAANNIAQRFTPAELLKDYRGRTAADILRALAKRFGFLIVTRKEDGMDVSKRMLARYSKATFKDMVVHLGAGYDCTIAPVKLADGRVLTFDEVVQEEMRRVIASFRVSLRPTVGFNDTLPKLAEYFDLNFGSSSAWDRLVASLEGTGQTKWFLPLADHIFSAKTHLIDTGEGAGKPSGDIYRRACKMRGVKPEQCIGIEDGDSGMDALADVDGWGVRIGYVGSFSADEQEAAASRLMSRGADAILWIWSFENFINLVFSVLVDKGRIVL